jgi:hypothetical protein
MVLVSAANAVRVLFLHAHPIAVDIATQSDNAEAIFNPLATMFAFSFS